MSAKPAAKKVKLEKKVPRLLSPGASPFTWAHNDVMRGLYREYGALTAIVYWVLCMKSFGKGRISVSQVGLSRELLLDRKTIRNRLRELEDCGLVVVDRRAGERALYRILTVVLGTEEIANKFPDSDLHILGKNPPAVGMDSSALG
jgi:hypothetical protein